MKKIIQNELPQFQVSAIPIADGGEGTLDCFSCIKNVSRIQVKTKNAHMQDIVAPYVRFDDVAVLETATVAGFTENNSRSNPSRTTTYGLGVLIRDAVNRGCKKIIIGLGGSSTNDGGCGMAAAIGTRFLDKDGNAFIPVGETLSNIAAIDTSETRHFMRNIEVVGMCDVTNPMYGLSGAAYVFAPQKGASPEDVILLDNELRALAERIESSLGMDVSRIPGGGAAGALGVGIYAFAGGKLVKGIDIILSMINFDTLIKDAAYVITGEGKFDKQSLHGKAISGICKAAQPTKTPIIVVAGHTDVDADVIESMGISALFETGPVDFSLPKEWLRKVCINNLERATRQVCQYIKSEVPYEQCS